MENLLRVATPGKASDVLKAASAGTTRLSDPRSDGHKHAALSTPETALEILKSRPEETEVLEVLRFLDPSTAAEKSFDITIPGPVASQILQVLVSQTIVDHWSSLWGEDESGTPDHVRRRRRSQAILLRCLSSVPGIGALIARLRFLLSRESHGKGSQAPGTHSGIRELLILLSSLLKPHSFLWHIYSDIAKRVQNRTEQKLLWKELTSFLAAGKVLSTSAEALKVVEGSTPSKSLWIGEGSSFALWLGANISYMAIELQMDDAEGLSCLSSFMGRAVSLGYTDTLVGTICSHLLFAEPHHFDKFGLLLDSLRQHEQSKLLEAVIRKLEIEFLSPYQDPSGLLTSSKLGPAIGGVSAVIDTVTKDRPSIKTQIHDWLVAGAGGSITSLSMRRALLAAAKRKPEDIDAILRRSIDSFGDKLFILHSPASVQQAAAEVILLAGGYLHKSNPAEFSSIPRSGSYLTAVSNRLAASSRHARFLGMVVAMAFSRLVDAPDQALSFDLDEMDSDEATVLLNLPNTNDDIGRIDTLLSMNGAKQDAPKKRQTKDSKPKTSGFGATQAKSNAKIMAIEEISDKSEAEDEDLMMYEKPDTDASDSEEDPTLIQRSKPSPPVYIRDLLLYLRDTDNAEKYHLGISTAPQLIRRKAGFGTEVIEHATDLALVLVSLQDRYKLPKFQELRIQSLVALIVAYPLTMGKWAAHTLFNADLSQSQRSSLLVAIGLSARELAGLKDEDAKVLGLPAKESETSFPSKRLPENLEDVYNATPRSIESLSKNISKMTLQPLALNAVDAATGPNALKIRTFSSRMEVEKGRQQREKKRKEKVSKDLHKILSDGLFSPLINEFALMMHSMSSYGGYNPFWQANLLSLFIETITIILSTLGPNAPNLASLTRESLTLLIALHNSPIVAEPVVLAALLRLFLAVVDISISSGSTAEERLVTELATDVMEMREWVGAVFEKVTKEDEEIRMLAAGIMVKLGEVTERFQGRLLGINSGFAY